MLLLWVAMGCLAVAQPLRAQVFGIYRELWTGLSAGSSDLGLLTNTVLNPRWPDNPTASFTRVFTNFETDINSTLIAYGQRLRTFVVPPLDGYYTFWIASDDASNLWLSSDESPGNKTLIARVDGLTNPREWSREANQQSAGIYLEKGRRYYLEVIHKQASGGDNLAVRWQLPDGTMEEPMTATSAGGTLLVPCGSTNVVPGIYVQPRPQSVLEGRAATFSLLVTNNSPVSYRWQLNGADIPGPAAAKPFYTISNVSLSLNDGQRYRCQVSNAVGAVTSLEVSLTVVQDTTPPTLETVENLGSTNLLVSFSEAVDAVSASDSTHYALDQGAAVLGVSALNGHDYILRTTPLVFGSNYALTVTAVRDLAQIPNIIAPNTSWSFVVVQYLSADVGGSMPPGSFTLATNGVDVTGGGADIGGKADQFQFVYQPEFGDFDVRVRVEGLSPADAWAKAGVMARTAFTNSSAFAGVFATPGAVGCYFESRNVNAPTARTGSFPVNYPYTWLRLQRSNDQLTGFASLDGEAWMALGVARLVGNPVYLGMAVDSHDTNQTVTARFRDWGNAGGGVSEGEMLPFEALGACSRRTGLVISEVMYHPASRLDGRNGEFVEIYNTQPFFEDMSGYQLGGSISFTFPPGTVLPAGAFLVVASVPQDAQAVYGLSNVLGPYGGKLPNGSGAVQLLDQHGALLLNIGYDSSAPWPAAPDGSGHSLVLARPSYGEGDARAWASSDRVGGSPGQPESIGPEPVRPVRINEFLAHPAAGQSGFVELYNHSRKAVDLSGAFLTDVPATPRFRIPDGTLLPGGGFVSFDQDQMGFGLNPGGGTVFLINSNQSRVIDAIRFEAQAEGAASGRSPNGAPVVRELSASTPGAANATFRVRDVVINEIMYKPISGSSDDQYVELYNRGTNAINLSGWKFIAGISYEFPVGTILPADGYLVVARNLTNILAHYANLNGTNARGNFGGSLSHNGERVALAMPEAVALTNGLNQLILTTNYPVVDEVTYGAGGRWGQWADGGGSSLELLDSRSDHRLAANWADSDESGKSTNWTTVEASGVLDQANGVDAGAGIGPQGLQIILLDNGECLVDNVEVLAGTNLVNLVTNSTFETGLGGWMLQGNHDQSFWDTGGGYNSSAALHVVTTGNGDLMVNRVATALGTGPVPGKSATLRVKARWLRGSPEILLTLRGNYLEAYGQMEVPGNLGTPGARNSRAVMNAGPAISDVTHWPALPLAGQAVVVTARVQDADGLAQVNLRYRLDPSGDYLTVAMRDDGSGGDAASGDGVFSGAIPGQAANTTVAFYVEAADQFIPSAWGAFPADAPARECLVRFGEAQPAGSLDTYHLWMSQATFNRWSAREKLSNEPLDCTFVNGSQRVIYNMGALYTGSPAHLQQDTPNGAWSDYSFVFPPDDTLLGVTSFNKIKYPSDNFDPTAQVIKTSYWLAQQMGLPYNHTRYINLLVNNVRRGSVIMDLQSPNSEVVSEFYPNDNNGELLKVAVSWESADGLSGFLWNHARLLEYLTAGGVKKIARYRWNWQKHAGGGSGNDYTNFFRLVDAANSAANVYGQQLGSVIDGEEWMRIFALEHAVGNWDSYGDTDGQNMYIYKPESSGWKLLIWDIDVSLGAISDGPSGDDLFKTSDPAVTTMYNFPPLRRAYFRGIQEMLNGPFLDGTVRPVLDATYAAFKANGLAVDPPDTIKTYITARRAYLQQQLSLATAPFSVSGTNVLNVSSNLVVLTGTAPVDAVTMTLNGAAYPVTWTTISNWMVRIVVSAPSNVFTLQAIDRQGRSLANETAAITVLYPGPAVVPQGKVVINEIMYHPAAPNAAYVELFNTSGSVGFDLSGWRLDGVGYTFPAGTLIASRQSLVVGQNQAAFLAAYSNSVPLAGEFPGRLDPAGGTLTLVQPGVGTSPPTVVNRVRYESAAPWPASADGFGPALQLIDASQDNSRVSNWSDGSGWRFASYTGSASGSKFIAYLEAAGDLYMDDISLVPGAVATAGVNLLRNGDFEGPLTTNQGGPWVFSSTNLAQTSISPLVKHSGNGGLHLVFATTGGSTVYFYQDGLVVTNGSIYTLSFWYLPTTNATVLAARVGNLVARMGVRPTFYTPGAPNSTSAPLPAYPPLWLNEALPENLAGLTNRAGGLSPWVEIYNAGGDPVSLDGMSLANDYANLTQWAFPTGLVINPYGFKLIFADGLPGQSTLAEPHASFSLSGRDGSVVMTRLVAGKPQVLDYLNYRGLPAGQAYGSFPDGQPFFRQALLQPTPGGTNNGIAPPALVRINEWMASNGHTLSNPGDGGKYDDWFELYNPGSNTVSLGGYFLSRLLTPPFQFQIPGGYGIPAGGHLLVWADNLPGLNRAEQPDLHVNFHLSKSGTTLGLFAPDGTELDVVSFGAQTADISQGRCPDGGADLIAMPSPTPRAANVCPGNAPPVLDPIAARTIYLGQSVVLTASASDSDQPPQSLSFSLEGNIPAGANIDVASGLFQWTPTSIQSVGTNLATIRVTDDGIPAQSDEQTFAIVVLAPPQVTAADLRDGNVSLRFPALEGRAYRIEYKNQLGDPGWTPLGTNTVVVSGVVAFQDQIGVRSNRFYRILVLP